MNEKISEILSRGVANIIPDRKQLEELLTSGQKLNIYMGIDPTATRIHIGHAVMLRKLNELAKLGHSVTFVVGDFTALIGDTSDKESERPSISKEEIIENFKNYKELASKVVDFSRVSIRHNSEWLSKLTFEEVVKLCQHFSAGDFYSRELIKKRLEAGKHVGLHEVLYPVMQGYDSYMLNTDIQLGGTDQTFNMQAGRSLVKDILNKESFVIAGEFLTGTDGRKMSKTWGNAIWLDDEPNDMYGKVMSLTDDLIYDYFMLGTSKPISELEQIKMRLDENQANPMEIKKELAFEIVKDLWDENSAKTAEENFRNTVQDKVLPEDMPSIVFEDDLTLIKAVSELSMVESSQELRRLVSQGGVTVNSERVDNIAIPLSKGDIVKLGKRKYFEVI